MKQLLWMALVVAFAGCTKNQQNDQPEPGKDDGSIGFATTVLTRGEVIDNTNIIDFGVFGYGTEHETWGSSNMTPTHFDNTQVKRQGSAAPYTWAYDGDGVQWGEASFQFNFSFFGYSPYATADNGISVPTPTQAGLPKIDYTTLTDASKQIDLLAAHVIDMKASRLGVKMPFRHVLSRIAFRAYSLVPGVTVSKIQITGVKYKGELSLDGSWSSAPDASDFTLTYTTPAALAVDATTTATATDLSTGANSFFLLPQDLTGNATAKIIFTFTTGGTEVTKEYVIQEEWAKSKAITYTVDLTTSLEEPLDVTDVTITEWGDGGNQAGEGEGEMQTMTVTYIDGGTPLPTKDKGVMNTEVTLTQRPTSAIEAWNTKADGSGDYYGQGDVVKLTGDLILYNVDNTVTIGGMRWLRGNLSGTAGSDTGHYAEGRPEALGLFFKWGDKWVYQAESSTTDGMMTDSGSTSPSSTSTEMNGYDYADNLVGGRSSGDPCKQLGDSWMTPTSMQYQTLAQLGSQRGTYHGVTGRFLGAKATTCSDTKIAEGCIFMPFNGYRQKIDGAWCDAEAGSYWTATLGYFEYANYFCFLNASVDPRTRASRHFAFGVRCVSTDVKIAGVNWVTTNLEGLVGSARNHKMAANPHDFGGLFKWGDRWIYGQETSLSDGLKGNINYPTTPITNSTGYDYGAGLAGGRATGDPCQELGKNYKTPTAAQYDQLINAPTIDGTYQGVLGQFFGTTVADNDKIPANSIFIPLAPFRDYNDGENVDMSMGFYWTSSSDSYFADYGVSKEYSSKAFRIRYGTFDIDNNYRAYGFSVRCIREN